MVVINTSSRRVSNTTNNIRHVNRTYNEKDEQIHITAATSPETISRNPKEATDNTEAQVSKVSYY